jgi:hypothetical protein
MMNERIEKLAEQATTYIEPTSTSGEGWIFDKEKFAHLILVEVIDILSTYRGKMVFIDGAEYNYEHPIIAIKKHFEI